MDNMDSEPARPPAHWFVGTSSFSQRSKGRLSPVGLSSRIKNLNPYWRRTKSGLEVLASSERAFVSTGPREEQKGVEKFPTNPPGDLRANFHRNVSGRQISPCVHTQNAQLGGGKRN